MFKYDDMTAEEYIESIKNDEGDLVAISEYVAYFCGSRDVCLDGNFTPTELKALADYIEQHQKP